MKLEKILEDLYLNHGLPPRPKFIKIIKSKKIQMDSKVLNDIVDGIISKYSNTREKFQRDNRRKVDGHHVSPEPFWITQMDLIDMSEFETYNKGYKWILIIIDVFSRHIFTVPMKDKRAITTLEGFKELENKKYWFKPSIILSDDGPEFKGEFTKYISDNHMILDNEVGKDDHKRLAVVDRVIMTIKGVLYKMMDALKTKKWTELLDDAVEAYNTTPHITLEGATPREGLTNDTIMFNIKEINEFKKDFNEQREQKLKVGDLVRVKEQRDSIKKRSYKQQWSDEAYVITGITKAHVYLDNQYKMHIDTVLKITDKEELQEEKKEIKEEIKGHDRAIKRLLKEGLVQSKARAEQVVSKLKEPQQAIKQRVK